MDTKLHISTEIGKLFKEAFEKEDEYEYEKYRAQFTSMLKLCDDVRQEVLKNKIRKVMYMEYEYGSKLDNVFMIVKDKEEDLSAKIKELRAKKNNNGFIWVTINPDPKSTTLKKFLKKVDVIAKRKCFTDYIYVIEQRATTLLEVGKGFHAHLLLRRNLNYKPCKCGENLRSSCKKLMPNPKNPQTLDVQIVGEEFARDKLDYILGLKTGVKKNGEKKCIAQKLDSIFRKNHGILEYYGNKNIL